jgi:hypothetical protein
MGLHEEIGLLTDTDHCYTRNAATWVLPGRGAAMPAAAAQLPGQARRAPRQTRPYGENASDFEVPITGGCRDFFFSAGTPSR